MKKRRQHYVWQHYLKPWTCDDRLYCLRDGKIFPTTTSNIANERDFYRMERLDNKHIAIIKKMTDNPNPLLQELRDNALYPYVALSHAEIAYTKIGKEQRNKEVESLFDTFRNNVFEDYLSNLENGAGKIINQLRSGDISFWGDNDECSRFAYFLAYQYFRTKKISKNVKASFDNPSDQKNREKMLREGIDEDKLWNALMHIFAIYFGASLYMMRNEETPKLLQNNTDIPFITGDQPVINTKANYSEFRILGREELELYYPLTPKLALLLNKDINSKVKVLSVEEVEQYNKLIFKASHEQVYADNEETLRRLKSID